MNQSEPISLPIHILASLYKNTLIADGSSTESAKSNHIEIGSGQHVQSIQQDSIADSPAVQKDTVVCVAYPAPALSAAHQALLKAILKACRLEDHQVELIIVTRPFQVNHETISAKFVAKNRLLFGLEPSDLKLPVHFPAFQVQSFNKANYLVAPKLESIEQDKTLKVQLWKSLQQLYPA
jgi:DNA polymerase III psi subunit